jgi:VWFA-related protein
VLAKINRVGSLIQPMLAGDRGRAAVIAFDDDVRVFQEFTSDGTKIRTAFARIQPRTIRSGKMIDAVAEAVRLLETQPENRRRVLMILSESRDRGSKLKLDNVLEQVERAGVMVYPATYSAYLNPWTAKPEDNPPMPGDANYMAGLVDLFRLGKVNAAEVLARSTGGRHLSFETLKGLEESIIRAGEEIHSQYLLSFVPQQTGGGYHHIEVALPARADALVRARPGYWASAN